MKSQTRLLNFFITLIAISISLMANAQSPTIAWQKTYGGSGDEYYGYILKLHDGNYLQYGNTASGDGDFSSNQGHDDAYMIKTDASGNILWSKTYGGKKDDGFNQVVETANGNLVAAGYTSSRGGDVHGNHGGRDGWLVLLNANGNILSQHCYGGSAYDDFEGMAEGDNKELYLTGMTKSTDGDLTAAGNHGRGDGWVIKINKKGNIDWAKCIGGSLYEQLSSIITIDNKIYVSGATYSFDGDATQNHSAPGFFDHFLAKFNPNGDVVWTACHGGSLNDYCLLQSLIATHDGNLMNVGTTNSNDGDVSGRTNYEADAWVPIISAETGALISQRCYGSVTRMQGLYSAYADEDGGYILVGSEASDFKVDSTWNAMVIKIDADGNEVWKTTFGGSDHDVIEGLAETDDGGYLLACYTRSSDGDVTNQHGGGDSWLVKLEEDGEKFSSAGLTLLLDLRNYPNPFSTSTTISFSLPHSENVSLKIYDVEGRLIRMLANENMSVGEHTLNWDARDENGNEVSAGIYLLRLQSLEFAQTIRLNVLD